MRLPSIPAGRTYPPRGGVAFCNTPQKTLFFPGFLHIFGIFVRFPREIRMFFVAFILA